MPQIDSHLTAKLYVDNAIDESSLLRLDPSETLDLDIPDSILVNSALTSPKKVIEIPTKAYIDSLHEENERSRGDLGLDFQDEADDLVKNNQDNNFNDNKLTNIDPITSNRKPTSDDELSNKKDIDDELDKNTIVRFIQTLSNYLKVSVGNDTYNLTKYDKIQLTDVTEIRAPSTGSDLLQKWKIINMNKIGDMKLGKFIKSTKTTTPSPDTGSSILPPIGNSYMFLESSSNNHGENVFCSFERTDIIQISKISFCYNRYSAENDHKAMGRLRIQLLLSDNTWSTRYNIPKNDYYTNQSEWRLVNLNFTEENYGIKMIYDEIDSANCGMCFSNITLTRSIY